ncbi:hypothetical protein [Streptomyces sp. NPDC017868]|uniref:hypothetical protein n=1 Tax=Streptomyces sp. NPDC017868 TaxID=3365014 RepID=UPI0037892495
MSSSPAPVITSALLLGQQSHDDPRPVHRGLQRSPERAALTAKGKTVVQRLEAVGVIRGYRAVIDPAGTGRSSGVLIDLPLDSQDAETGERSEQTVAQTADRGSHRAAPAVRRPDHFVRVGEADRGNRPSPVAITSRG